MGAKTENLGVKYSLTVTLLSKLGEARSLVWKKKGYVAHGFLFKEMQHTTQTADDQCHQPVFNHIYELCKLK